MKLASARLDELQAGLGYPRSQNLEGTRPRPLAASESAHDGQDRPSEAYWDDLQYPKA